MDARAKNVKFAFKLCLDDFDPKGNMNKFKGDEFMRGPSHRQFSYKQPPSEWCRIGLKVEGKYPHMRWLSTDGNSDEWYVCYHGVRI